MFFDGLQKPSFYRFSAEASLINTAGLLLHSYHTGKDVSFARSVALGDLTRFKDVSDYKDVYVSSSGIKLLSDGYTGDSKALSGVGPVSKGSSPKLFHSLTPSGYGTVSAIRVTMTNNGNAGTINYVTVYSDGVLVAESEHVVNPASSTTFIFPISFEVDPNKTYDLYFSTNDDCGNSFSSRVITAVPTPRATGWAMAKQHELPSYATRLALNVYASGTEPVIELRNGNGNWSTCIPVATKQANSQTGSSCTLYSYDVPLSLGAQTMQLRVTLNAYDTCVYGYSGAIL